MLNELLIILALILTNGIFAGAEIAILSLRKTRIAELVDSGNTSAQAVARLRENPESFLATVQIGITVVGATAAAFGGSTLADQLAPTIATVPGLEEIAPNLAFFIVVGIVSFLSLVLGELVPKSLALRAGETYALLISQPLSALAWSARPVVALLTGASNVVLRLFGDKTNFTETRLSLEEIQQIVDEAASLGSLDPHAGEIASRAIDFSTLDAYTVMVPRPQIVMVSAAATPQEIAEIARTSRHSRLPVYDDSRENVIGFINLRDALAHIALNDTFSIHAQIHPIPFIPDSMSAPAVLRKLQQERSHIAMVIDEQGTLVGLLTIEDLVEEMVGEILSENDKPASTIVREPDGSMLVPGNMPIHEVNRELAFELPDGDFSTVAGLCLSLSEGLPPAGTTLTTEEGISLEIIEVTPRRIKRIRLRRPSAAATAE